MQTKTFFSYYWHTDNDNDTNTIIRIYGLDKDNKNVCVIVSNFTPYVYIELPKPYSQWNETTSQILGNKLDEILGEKRPIVKSFMKKYKLYYAYIDIKTKKRIKFPYLFCSFSNANDVKNMYFKLKRNIYVQGIGNVNLKVHESDASPVLQMCCLRNISTAGWIKFNGNLIDDVDEKITYCDYEYKVRWKNLFPDESNDVPLPLIMGYDIEVNSSIPSAMPESKRLKDKIFQISCSLSRPNMKEEEYENHLLSLGNPSQERVGKNIILHIYDTESELLIGFTNFIKKYQPNIITGYNIFTFDIPYMIDRAKINMCIYDFNQQSFIKNGHSTEKSIKWSSSAYKDQFFQYLDAEGRLFVDLLPLIRRDYKFANYKLKTVATNLIGQTKDDLSPQGIFKCYRIGMKGGEAGAKALGICGKYCVKDTVLVLNLFEKIQCWIGLTEMAKVCKTSIFSLYTQGQQIKVYSQMYHDCTYKNYVVEKDGYITKEDEYFQGAMVFDPITGLHENVVSFDFNSLYPSTMIAYNLDYSTLVPDNSDIPDNMCGVFEWDEHQGCIHDPNMIKKNDYSIEIKVIYDEIKSLGKERDKKIDKIRKKEIQKKIDNLKLQKKPLIEKRAEYTKKKPKNIMCGKRKFRFLKSEYSVGLMPNILKDLIKARSNTRVEKKDVDEKIKILKKIENPTKEQREELSKLETLTIVLDKRQLAYKISANSAYGATGVRRGYLPCMPVAMTTTALGRQNIEKVANIIPEIYGGKLIYGDTDSNYVTFPNITNYVELWEHCKKVSKEVSDMFPKPNALEFEGEIYQRYLILTKKRYMYISSGKDGKILTNKDGTQKIGKKGVLLQRRDNCDFVRELYSNITMEIFNKVSRDDIIYNIIEELNRLCSNQINYKKFITTKAVGNIGDKDDHNNIQNSSIIKDERGNEKTMVGGYKVPLLSKDPKTRQEQLNKKNATDQYEYYLRCLPAQVQLAEKMRKRGQIVDVGSRLEYIITDPMNVNGKQYEKIEDVEYYLKFSHLVKIDVFHYLKSLVNPIDQILNCIYNKDEENNYKYKFKYNFMKSQYDFRLNVRQSVIEEIKSLTKPVLIFEKELKIKEIKKDTNIIILEDDVKKEIDLKKEKKSNKKDDKEVKEIDLKKEKRRKKKEENKLILYNDMLRISSNIK